MNTAHSLTLACALALVLSTASAARAADKEEPSNTLPGPLAQLPWTKGPAKAKLGNIAEIQVPAGFMFTGAEGAQTILQAFGNPTDGSEIGFLSPTSMVWSVVFEWADSGYVKDDDKDKLDADAMLGSMRKGNEAANEWRRENGQSELTVTGWAVPPRYNEETHNLEWAIKGEASGDPIVNYNVRLLGRKGVMSATLLVDPDQMDSTLPEYRNLLANYSFQQGERYAEYKDGDKVAKYGLAALVVGGAAAGAAKLGLFAWLAVFLKKGWKLIVVAIVGIGAALKKLLGGRQSIDAQQ